MADKGLKQQQTFPLSLYQNKNMSPRIDIHENTGTCMGMYEIQKYVNACIIYYIIISGSVFVNTDFVCLFL